MGSAFLELCAATFLVGVPVLAGFGPAADGQDEALAEARAALESPDRERRASAVRRLAGLDRQDAWRLVAEALADTEGCVAEAAEHALGRARSLLALEQLAGRRGVLSSDAAVAPRAARALGRSSAPPPVRALLRAVASRDEDTRSASLWAVERAATAGRWPPAGSGSDGARGFEEIARLVRRGRSDRVRARALHALVALDAARATPLVRAALESREAGLRAAACEPAGRLLPVQQRWPITRELLADQAWSVRLAAVDAAVSLATPAAVPALIERLASDARLRVRRRALEGLRELSGLRHGPDPRPWRDWSATLEENGLPARPRGGEHRGAAPAERTLAMDRVTIDSEHAAFLIDLSGSMWSRHGSLSRKEVVDQRFGALLQNLAPDVRFLLVPFTGRPHPWEDEPRAATARNVAAARRYFESCSQRGPGDFWEAALLALEHEEIDTLVVLTDGVPTGGAYNRMDLLTEAFAERNLARRVTVDALLIQATPAALRSWTRFCASTGGRCIPVDLGG